MNLADDLVVDDPFEFVIFLNGNSMQISSGLEVILDFGFTKFGGMSCAGAQIPRSQLILISLNLMG